MTETVLKSLDLFERRKAVVANGVGVFNTATVSSAKGATIIDADGKELIDFAGGIGVVNAGHCPDSVVLAIQEQASKYIHTSFNVVTYEPYVKLCEELTEIVWPEQNYKNSKNSRGVTIRKLRIVLEQLDKVEIIFQRDRWSVMLSNQATCDYFECIDLLENPQFHSLDYYYHLFQIVEDGQIVKNETYEWMDDIKGYVDYCVIDILLKYISLLDHEKYADLILKIIDRIHISDPVNEKAFELKVKILLTQDNHNYAKYCHETFSKNFEEFYGQVYQRTYEDIVSLVSQ